MSKPIVSILGVDLWQYSDEDVRKFQQEVERRACAGDGGVANDLLKKSSTIEDFFSSCQAAGVDRSRIGIRWVFGKILAIVSPPLNDGDQ